MWYTENPVIDKTTIPIITAISLFIDMRVGHTNPTAIIKRTTAKTILYIIYSLICYFSD